MAEKIMHHTDAQVPSKIESFIRDTYRSYKSDKDIIVVCPGNDKTIFDCYGPLVGTFLNEMNCKATIIGTLDDPILGTNIKEKISLITSEHFVIAVDAIMGDEDSIGDLILSRQSIRPTSGTRGEKIRVDVPPIGNVSICGITDDSLFSEAVIYKTTRLCHVYKMAKATAFGILQFTGIK